MRWKARKVKDQFKRTVKIELKIPLENTLLKLLVKKYIKRNTISDHVFVKEVKSIRMLKTPIGDQPIALSKMLHC